MALLNQLRKLAFLVLIFILGNVLFLRNHYLAVMPLKWTPPENRPVLNSSVHTLPTADSFLPHFAAVTALKSLPLSEAKASCNWPAPWEVNFQYGGDVDWVVKERDETELEMRRKQWHSFIDKDLMPYAEYEKRFEGRGVIIVAGNSGTLERLSVILRALAKVGSKLPVEIHHWKDEISPKEQKKLTDLWPSTYFNDLSAPRNIIKTSFNFFMINYQLKTAAIMNSRFAEVLLLDSDNVPILDPESLFESQTYREYGTIFWPDIARTRPSNPMWAITNTECRMDEYEQESGQLLVDKRRFFYHLQLAAWFNNNHTEYFNGFLLGDKDLFRFSWHALKTAYGKPPKWITSVGTLTDGFYCGHTFAQHDTEGRMMFFHGGLLKAIPNAVMRWHRENKGGMFQAYKRSEFDELHVVSVNVSIKWDRGDYVPNKPQDTPVWSCTDFYQVDAKPLHELMWGFEGIFQDIGGYWMLD